MTLWNLSLQNLKSKPLYSFLSVFTLALGIALLLGMQQLKQTFKHHVAPNLGAIDVVVGAKGSPLQLVLASVLHVDHPTGNIAYVTAQKIAKNPMVKSAVPLSYGDNYKGFRIVGTTAPFLTLYQAEFNKGRKVEKAMEVVLGATVAQQLQLRLGDRILSAHGLLENSIDVHADAFTVVGILKPTQKVIDRLIICNLQSVWEVHKHEDRAAHASHDHGAAEKEITALLVTFKSPRALLSLPPKLNKMPYIQAALPKYELDKLYENMGIGFKAITGLAYLIFFISGLILFTNLYKMVKERTFDVAILRTYGASHTQLIRIVAQEGLAIGIVSFISAYALITGGLGALITRIHNTTHMYTLQSLSLQELLETGISVFILIIASVLLAIYPILKMDISTILSHDT